MPWSGNTVFAHAMKMRSCRGCVALRARRPVSVQGQGHQDMGCGGRQAGREVLPAQDSRCLQGLRDAGGGASPEPLKEPP